MKQRKIQISIRAVAIALLCAYSVGKTYAQTPVLVLPPHPDNTAWYLSSSGSGTSPIMGMNTAMIAYGNTTTPSSIVASVYNDNTAAPTTLYLRDDNWGGGVTASIALNTTVSSTPDVIIGNYDPGVGGGTGSCASYCSSGCYAQTDFLVAVAYVNGSGDAQVDFFHVVDDGFTTFSVACIGSDMINPGAYVPHTVHIDVLAEAGNTTITGFPFCDRFAVAFDDYSTPTSPNIYVAEGSLNTQMIATEVQINPTSSSTYGFAPDVALVQRKHHGTIPPLHDEALVTYVDAGGNTLYYEDYDFTIPPSTLTTSTLDNGTNSYNIQSPRIDAFDDFSHYNPGTIANYKVVAQVQNTSTPSRAEVRNYDDLLGTGGTYYWASSSIIDLTGYGYPTRSTYNSYSPTVAIWGQQLFFVTHYMDYPSLSAPANNGLFMEPVDLANSSSPFNNYYYWVNGQEVSGGGGYTPPPGVEASGMHASAVACAPNQVGNPYPIYTWAENVPGSGYSVLYKYPQSNLFDFRTAPSSVATATGSNWQLYPNPATDELHVQTAEAGSATAYCITDMAGRELAHGDITTTTTTIPTGILAAGTYVLQLYNGKVDAGKTLFVKE